MSLNICSMGATGMHVFNFQEEKILNVSWVTKVWIKHVLERNLNVIDFASGEVL